MRRTYALLLSLLMWSGGLLAQPGGGGGQNNTCETADPFCTGTLYNFPAGVNAGNGQAGPCYSCLTTRPNPAWYYMKVANSGNIIIQMHSEPAKDIDFCCWGPFPSENACTQLTCNKVVSCSYSASAYETCNIPNGVTGEYYILIITNYSNQPCNIIFQQTGGTGTTDCTILPPACTNNSPICEGQTLQLSAQPVNNAQYHWWGPANFVSTVQNPVIHNATPANAGDYFLRITVNGQPSQDTSVTTAYVYQPEANAGNDTTVNNGVFITLHGNASGGSGSYQYHWEPASKLVDPNIRTPQTVNLFTTTLFTLEVTDDSASCTSTDMVNVVIAGGALAVNTVASPGSICAGASTQLQALGSGGTGTYTYEWSGPNGFTSTMQNPTVVPVATSTYNVTISDGFNTSGSSVTVTVIPLPIANAGPDQEIPYEWPAWLSGSVTGGSGNYLYTWSPLDKLVNAYMQSPQTIPLTSTTVFSLSVTDMITNCASNNQANTTVEVVGGPLNVNPAATPGMICRGDTTQLHAAAGGGNVGNYTYTWTSDPEGFTSDVASPFVAPLLNTRYHIKVSDGQNSTNGHVDVGIYSEPAIRLGPPDTLVCIYDTVLINAGNPGCSYVWSNGATTQTIRVGTTGIGFDTQTYSVEVTNPQGCSGIATINVVFSFDACTSVNEDQLPGRLRIYPNPANEKVNVETDGISGNTTATLLTPFGREVGRLTLPPSTDGMVTTTLDLKDLPKGLYLVRFINSAFSHTAKLLVE